MSKQIPMLMGSPLSKRVYVVTNYKEMGNGTYMAREKHDVTEQFDALAATRRGECDAILDESYYKGIHGYCECLKCSNCGEPLFSEFKNCPWCGALIRKAVKR